MSTYLGTVKGYIEKVRALHKMVGSHSELGKALDEVADIAETYFKEMHPFKVGQRVVLNKNLNCANGWKPYRHVLVKGGTGTVADIGLWTVDGGVYVVFCPDNQTCMNDEGKTFDSLGQDHVFWVDASNLSVEVQHDMSYSEGI